MSALSAVHTQSMILPRQRRTLTERELTTHAMSINELPWLIHYYAQVMNVVQRIFTIGFTNNKCLRHLGSQMPSSPRITNFEEKKMLHF